MDWDELLPEKERAPQAKQQPLEEEGLPSLGQDTNPALQGVTGQATTIDQAASSVPPPTPTPPPGFTLPPGWTFPAPDTSGAPLNRVINAAYQQIHGVYLTIKAKEAEGELTPERAAELRARLNAVLKSEKVVNAEEAIAREFRSFQDAVNGKGVASDGSERKAAGVTGVTDHKGKAAAAGNVRAGCAWLVKYVRWWVWSEEGKEGSSLQGQEGEKAV